MRPVGGILLSLAAACASAPPRADDAELKELRGQISAQALQLSEQQRRLDDLEMRFAGLSARSAAPTASANSTGTANANPTATTPNSTATPNSNAGPTPKDPRPALKTVKLPAPGGRRARRDFNPVERAPQLPSSIELKEPDERVLAKLEEASIDARLQAQADADHAFARAVRTLNDGNLAQAENDLLAFAGRNPRHSAADNAIYLAGMIRANHGDCPGAVALFDRVPTLYPAGDAVAPALLEKGRCLKQLSRSSEARAVLGKIAHDYPATLEASVARQLLQDL